MTRFSLRILLLLTAVRIASGAALAQGIPDDLYDPRSGLGRADGRLGGRLEATIDGETYVLPTIQNDVHADIAGDLATVTVVQTFANPSDQPMKATYVFPLDENAAVFEMVMMVGGEVIRAEIHEVEEARRTFEAAKRAGKSAALLCEHRPNLFTQEIANLMPDLPVTVSLRYVEALTRVDDAYELVVPLVVGPRYVPAEREDDSDSSPSADARRVDPVAANGTASGGWRLDALPAQAPVFGLDVPDVVDGRRVSISIDLDGGMPVASVESPTHPVAITEVGENGRRIELAEGRTFDNRDFVLRYRLAGDAVAAGVLASHDPRGGFFSLLIEPPAEPRNADVTPREMVFVLDCSGSMAGLPIEASKAFMRQALKKLRRTDSFRIIRFSDSATEFSAMPLPADPSNVASALAYVDRLNGEGGTEMTTGMRQALEVPEPPGVVRIVVFLTDGYIGNEHEVLGLIEGLMGDARLFAFGVGTAVNRFLLSEMGRIGRGFTRYMDPTEKVEEVAADLADRLQSPVLTDIEIDWGDLAPTETFPARIPDLFAGHGVRVAGRFEKPGRYEIAVRGRINGRAARLPLSIEVGEQGRGDAVALTWARAAIADAMEQATFPVEFRDDRTSDEAIRKRVTDLGLEFSLVTRWTSFVAVSETIVNTSPESTVDAAVPVPMVEGVSQLAYHPAAPVPVAAAAPVYNGAVGGAASSSSFSGSGAPEPATMTGLLIAAGAGVAGLRRRRRVGSAAAA